ncbi:uncharacterized protein LOC125765959 [Anopheles funestus]|uniref:uncharacterized protein LOC125765959 n=1 Tax=Anopheles funestus TaxID=62324 RepID=UPI0020C7019C|nr:uncharacterized protein LOC125765959 [Anopheles funestus]
MSLLDNSIHITHYINPHCFYYKPETAYMQEHEQAKFAAAFNEWCEKSYGTIYDTVRNTQPCKHPLPGELVALCSNQLQRWIRCEMEEVTVDVDDTTWYYLWAIDEGLPIKTHTKYVRPLPKEFVKEPAHAIRGAIINILPGETRFDYEEDKQILVPTTKWSPGIVSTLEFMLENAESISFLPSLKYVLKNETINIGELFIITQANVSYSVAQKLHEACSDQVIVTQNAKFLKGIEYLRALNKKRYLNNEGFDNHAVNKFETYYLQASHDSASHANMGSETDSTVTVKVYEWLRQNKEARIAILEQQKAKKDRIQEPPAINNIASASGSKTDVTDSSFHKLVESGTDAVPFRSKPSNLIKNIKRHQTRQLSKTAAGGSPSIASE